MRVHQALKKNPNKRGEREQSGYGEREQIAVELVILEGEGLGVFTEGI